MKHILLILLALNSGFCVNAQMPAGFKDFNVASGLASSAPMYLAGMNGKLYFYGSNGSSGREPFYMESTGISQLIQNMNPGGNHCIGIGYTNPSAIMNNKYYFTATNGSSGEEMFMYDGTNPPTIVFDPTFGPDSSQPDNYVVYNNSLYFTATTATEGSELYVFDGINTPVRLTDINSGAEGSVFGPMVLLGDKLIFSGKNMATGAEPWAYDLINNTAAIIEDIDTGATSSAPTNFKVINNKLYFSAATVYYGRELYVYDGTNPPQRLTDINPGGLSSLGISQNNPFALFNNLVYFGARDASNESHLWYYDPANGNVALAQKINQNGDASPRDFVVYNGRLFFTANDGVHGFELYTYDGTSPPAMVGDLCQGPNSSLPTGLTPVGDELYFSANNCDNSGVELFSYNYQRVGIDNVTFDAETDIYPNPVEKNLYMELRLNKAEELQIRLSDISGRNIYNTGLLSWEAGNNKTEIPMQHLQPGVYFYYITSQDGITHLAGKVVKK